VAVLDEAALELERRDVEHQVLGDPALPAVIDRLRLRGPRCDERREAVRPFAVRAKR
jgi:hypothetical protein